METFRYSPFPNPIVNNELTPGHPRIRELKNTGFYVRAYDYTRNPNVAVELLGDYKRAIRRWKRLGEYDGVNLPRFSSVIGVTDTKNPSFFIVTEKIDGPNLKKLFLSRDEIPTAKHAFDTFMTGLVAYSSNAYEKRGEYLRDQDLSQYVYGKSQDGEKKVYFVDLGLEYLALPQDRHEQDVNSHFFATYMFEIFLMLQQLEVKVGGPLINTRNSFREFLESIPRDDGGASYAKGLLDSVLCPRLSGI